VSAWRFPIYGLRIMPLKQLPMFATVRTSRLFEEICDRIRESIASGSLKPGDKLPAERELSTQFGVSRTVLREALRSLEIAGLVRLYKGATGGAVILDGGSALARSFKDMIMLGRVTIEDLTEARILIEDVIVGLACTRATKQDFRAIGDDVAHVEALAKAGRLGEKLEDNVAFYELLAQATHNQTLVLISQSLSRVVYHIVLLIGPGPLNDLAIVRRQFLDHFMKRDAKNASRVLREHFLRLQAHLVRHQKSASNRLQLASSELNEGAQPASPTRPTVRQRQKVERPGARRRPAKVA
jgi:GntR family transcriptional regulator, transcriptional repressor for pyruvate dehydrogenase complex